MIAPAQLDLFEALAGKVAGLARAELHNRPWVEAARAVARRIALERGSVTADDVRAVLYPMGLKPAHPNAWGTVFQRGFRWTGERRVSAVVAGHGNMQRVWAVA